MSEKRDNALIIVDLQLDFCPGGSLEVKEGDRVIPVINQISGNFFKVIATQDWHPDNHISFAKNHKDKEPFTVIEIKGIEQTLWPVHCVQGSEGAMLHPDLDLNPVDLILRKGTNPTLDSYSAFFENDHKTSTGLEYYLKGLNIKKVFVCGLATDYCVFYTAMDARLLGFETFVIDDASRGVDFPPGNLNQSKDKMLSAGIKIIDSKRLKEYL